MNKPTLNIEHSASSGVTASIASALEFITLCCADAGKENSDEFVSLTHSPIELWIVPKPRFPMNQPEPAPRFSEFLKAQFHLVHEIFRRFCRFGDSP